MTCSNCETTITDTYHARSYHHRGATRWLCGNSQECGERAVALRLGIPVATQQAWFATKQAAA